jgi:hypothetical protein
MKKPGRWQPSLQKPEQPKLLVFVYYSGHGVMDDTTHIVVNSQNSSERYFDLEAKLFILSQCCKSTYTMTLLDCCRESVDVRP